MAQGDYDPRAALVARAKGGRAVLVHEKGHCLVDAQGNPTELDPVPAFRWHFMTSDFPSELRRGIQWMAKGL